MKKIMTTAAVLAATGAVTATTTNNVHAATINSDQNQNKESELTESQAQTNLNNAKAKQAAEEIKKYVNWYNNERIQKNLGYLSPVQYRLKYSN